MQIPLYNATYTVSTRLCPDCQYAAKIARTTINHIVSSAPVAHRTNCSVCLGADWMYTMSWMFICGGFHQAGCTLSTMSYWSGQLRPHTHLFFVCILLPWKDCKNPFCHVIVARKEFVLTTFMRKKNTFSDCLLCHLRYIIKICFSVRNYPTVLSFCRILRTFFLYLLIFHYNPLLVC